MKLKSKHEKLLELIDLSEENNAILVIKWHNRSFNENEFPGYLRTYCEIIEACKKRNAIF